MAERTSRIFAKINRRPIPRSGTENVVRRAIEAVESNLENLGRLSRLTCAPTEESADGFDASAGDHSTERGEIYDFVGDQGIAGFVTIAE
jgi:hypothetical protein